MTLSCHIETIPLIYSAGQWTFFYMTGTSVMKKLKLVNSKEVSVVNQCFSYYSVVDEIENCDEKLR